MLISSRHVHSEKTSPMQTFALQTAYRQFKQHIQCQSFKSFEIGRASQSHFVDAFFWMLNEIKIVFFFLNKTFELNWNCLLKMGAFFHHNKYMHEIAFQLKLCQSNGSLARNWLSFSYINRFFSWQQQRQKKGTTILYIRKRIILLITICTWITVCVFALANAMAHNSCND